MDEAQGLPSGLPCTNPAQLLQLLGATVCGSLPGWPFSCPRAAIANDYLFSLGILHDDWCSAATSEQRGAHDD